MKCVVEFLDGGKLEFPYTNNIEAYDDRFIIHHHNGDYQSKWHTYELIKTLARSLTVYVLILGIEGLQWTNEAGWQIKEKP